MRIISLNTWGGRGKNITEFVKQNSEAEIFCFQELTSSAAPQPLESGAMPDLFQKFSAILNQHQRYFFNSRAGYDFGQRKVNFPLENGHGIFVKGLNVLSSGSEKLPPWDSLPHISGFISYVSLPNFAVISIHGIWTGKGKDDSPERLSQSEALLKIADSLPGEKIIIGDFNLNPNTQSLALLSARYRNLISEYGIATTRSDLYDKKQIMPLADYCFVSGGVKVKDFQVPNTEASDHLPLILDFEI